MIHVENMFEEIINYKNYKYAYEYHKQESPNFLFGLLKLSETQFTSRIDGETKKHGNYTMNGDLFKDLPRDQSDAMLEIVGSKKTYVTPESIVTPEEKIKVDMSSTVSSHKINEIFTKINTRAIPRKSRKSNLISKTSFVRNSISNNNRKLLLTPPIFKRYTFKTANSSEQDQKDIDFIESFNYLGNNSPFVTETLESKKIKPMLVESDFKKVTDKLTLNFNLRNNSMVSMKRFDLNLIKIFLSTERTETLYLQS